MPARGLLLALFVIALCALGAARPAVGGDGIPSCGGQGLSLADLGEKALEKLPWDVKIVRANLSAERPVAIAACYLMQQDLLVVTREGLVYCMSRRDFTPRWVSALKWQLDALPSEGPLHYTFLMKATDGASWVQAFRKRSGAEETGFPARLGFASSSGVTNNGSRVWIGSLGSPRNNRTVESVSLVNGRPGWGWRTCGLLWASPVVDPSGNSLVIAGEDGTVTSLPTGAEAPSETNWSVKLTGAVTATPVVTPEHVLVGAQDGTLRCIELASGEILWLHGLDSPLRRSSLWVLGRMGTVTRSTGVEGAPEVQVKAYTGIAFARNRDTLFAYDLSRGGALFQDAAGRRPICMHGRWVVTLDEHKRLAFRDAKSDYEVKGKVDLSMFDLIPSNSTDGAIFGCTHDGGLVVAIPTP